jgi:ABC-type Fe3+/spermidine/putrescine transport system ATPase subunit
MALLELQNLTQRFGSLTALDNFNLSVGQGEFVSLLGPSGCGKTTTIRLVAGFLNPTQGKVLVNGRDISPLPPEKRDIGMVFQSYALFPHLNVFENVAFGLRAKKLTGPQVGEKVEQALALVNLTGYGKRPVSELSGGEQQRVAIARTLVIEPQILLLDEPLSNLDASLREETRRQLRHLIDSLGITAIFVTHDQEEAFALSDRIALLSKGVCQQVGTPQELYYRPVNEFVAKFIGNSNLFSLPFKTDGEDCLVFSLPGGNDLRIRRNQPWQFRKGEVCRLLLRPERIEFEKTSANIKLITAKIMSQQFSGAFSEYELEGEGLRLTALQTSRPDTQAYSAGESLDIYYSPDAIYVFQCGS